MRQSQIGSLGRSSPAPSPPASSPARTSARRWVPVLATRCSGRTVGGRPAQTSQSDKEKIAPTGAADARPLARYVPKENLVFYAEFAGLDAHADAWQKTAAYKMLNQTPLGVMLEEVGAQLLDKGMSFLPNRRLSGTDVVTLVKNTAKSGWVFGFNASLKGQNAMQFTLVLRGASSKEHRKLTSGLLGMMMGTSTKPKLDHKGGRTLVVLQYSGPEASWAWWPEEDDLVICMPQTGVDVTLSVLDGKVPPRPTIRESRHCPIYRGN